MIGLLLNSSRHADDEVRRIVEFAHDHVGIEKGRVAVRVKERRDGNGGGWAFDSKIHGGRRWTQGIRYGVTLNSVGDQYPDYCRYRACWHSTQMREWGRMGGDRPYTECKLLVLAGKTKVGRWPIYRVDTWQEHLVHLAAHELAHVLAFTRERRTTSEIWCEEVAARVLDAYRLTNTTGTGMLLVPNDPKEVSMSTIEAPEAPPVDKDAKQLDDALRDEITPIKSATVVKTGGRTVTPKKEPGAAGGTRRSSKTRQRTKTSKRETAKPKKVSALAAAEIVLKRASGPLHVNEITKRILAMPSTGLKGKTPEASVGAILAVNAKKRDSAFKRTAPSTYTLKGKK